MPEISHQQAAALAVLEWFLDDDVTGRRSGRSMALALGFLRYAVNRTLNNSADREWIRIFDHFPMGADTSHVVLRYIEDIAQAGDAQIEVQSHRFRLAYCTRPGGWTTFRDYLYNEFVETDIHRGLSQEQIEREQAMRAGPVRPPEPGPTRLPRRVVTRSSPTLRERIVAYVRQHPGKTATQIASALQHGNDAVASTLLKEVKEGALERRPGEGPRGGFSYYPTTTVVGPSVWELLRRNPYDGAGVVPDHGDEAPPPGPTR